MTVQYYKKGGSLASRPYSNLPKSAPKDLAYPAAYDNIISAQELVKNYGSVYKTTGGGLDGNKAYKFVHKFIDNRVLDIYLKYLGITTLTPTTLVPIALIYGQQAFKKALKYMKSQEQSGGSIPVLDNNLVGTYLKIAGLSQLSLSPHTLVPLGLAMAIYKAFSKKHKNEQKGGRIAKLFTGEYVPPGFLQLGNMIWDGQTIPNNISTPLSSWQQLHRPLSYINHELQTPCSGDTCSTAGLPAPPPLDKLFVDVKGMDGPVKIADKTHVLGAKPLPENQFSAVEETPPDWGSAGQSGVQYSGVDVSDLVMRNQMAGGGSNGLYPPRTNSVNLYNSSTKDTSQYYDLPSNKYSGGGNCRQRRSSPKRNSSRNRNRNRRSKNNKRNCGNVNRHKY